jgi:hypothetical protein
MISVDAVAPRLALVFSFVRKYSVKSGFCQDMTNGLPTVQLHGFFEFMQQVTMNYGDTFNTHVRSIDQV